MGAVFNDSDIINIKDTETGLKMLDKLSRIKDGRRVEPLSIADNIRYPHRYLYDEYNLQIGDTYFMIPPEFIMVNSEATSQSIVTLRQENTQKMKSGYHKRTILIDLVFSGIEQLNGYPVDGPEGTYYVDGLRQLLAQFKCTPFLPIMNEMINSMYGIFTVALQAITMRTMPGYPDVMTAQITLQEVNMYPYTEMPDACFKYMIDWDLFRYYYQRLLTEENEYKKLQRLPNNKEHNRFKISILDDSVFSSKEATRTNFLNIICDYDIVKTNEDGTWAKSNYTTWVDSAESNVNISSFQCGYSNLLTNIQLSDISSPTLQFIGGMDTIYNIVFETTDYNVVQALEQCQITNDLLTRNNIKLSSVGFVKLESELVAFTGSLFVMIESVTTNTVPGFPGLYNVQMTCVAYDIAQSKREELHGFKPFPCDDCVDDDFDPDHVHNGKDGYSNETIEQSMEGLKIKIRQDNYAEWKIRTSMEVYPDLHLPTYFEVNEFITKCIDFRNRNNLSTLPYTEYPTNPMGMIHGSHPDNEIKVKSHNGVSYANDISKESLEYKVYVDPDFYVFYPCSYSSFQAQAAASGNKYYDYEPVQREPYSETMVNTKTPNYGEGSMNTNLVDHFIALAKRQVGCEYKSGAAGEISDTGGRVFDCSGFVTYLLKEIGVIPANKSKFTVSTILTDDTFEEINWSDMQKGDLLIPPEEGHVVIYEGDGQVIHASNSAPYPRGGVKESNLYFDTGRCFRVKAFVSATENNSGSSVYSSVNQIIQQDLGNWSPITVEEMNNWIASKAPSNSPFRGQGEIFIRAAQESGLDPRYILAHAAWESGWGTSRIARDKNNYFGIGAFDASPYQSAYSFGAGLAAGIIGGAKWIAKNYYNGKYSQKTLYSMRWNNGVHQYATDPKWHIGIANIMLSAPNNNASRRRGNGATLTKDEFESICRIVMAETKGESPSAEKAVAQVIYDRLTHPENKFAGLSNILNNSTDQFPLPYQGALNSTVEDSVKAVFCNNDKYWPNHTVWYFLTPDDTSATFKHRNMNYDRIGEVDKHTFWGKADTAPSSVMYTITDGTTGSASNNIVDKIQDVLHDAKVADDVGRFAEPVLVKTDAIIYDDNWTFWQNNDVAKDNAKNHLNDGLNIFYTSFCDEYQYSGRGRLVRAFPAYLFCILDDNAQWFDGRKLWTNYYVHRSVVDIAVHGTNDMPTETATITVTNSYHNLDRTQGGLNHYSIYEDEGYAKWIRDFYKFSGILLDIGGLGGPRLTDKLIKLQQVIYDHAKLRENARIHLRVGYGSDPLSLAPVMNGHISDVALGDQINIVVSSDGHELLQHVVSAKENDTNNGLFGLFGFMEDQESSNIIANIMCKRQNWFNYLAKQTFEGSANSIEHFGLFFNQSAIGLIVGVATGAIAGGKIGASIGAGIGSAIPGAGTVIGGGVGGLIGIGVGALAGAFFDSDITIEDLWNGYQEQYDICKNIYKANYSREHYIYGNFADVDGEQNFVFNQYNMTPWDVFQMSTQQAPEYIVKVSYHQFDSRLYFGLPFLMEKFRYDYLDSKVYEECKSASQIHLLDCTNIIDNQIKVTSKYSTTNVKVMYTRGNTPTSTKVIHSDDTIDFAYQKTKIIDTTVVQDAFGPDILYEFLSYNVGEECARRIGISNLLYGWQQQYQGQILLTGCSGIKPHDYVMIYDAFSELYGIAIVREVTHNFSINTGFTTSVTLGMIGFSTDKHSGMIVACQNILSVLNCFSHYIESRRQLRNEYEKNASVFAEYEVIKGKLEARVSRAQDLHYKSEVANVIGKMGLGGIALYRHVRHGNVIMQTKKTVDAFRKAYTVTKNGVKGFKAFMSALKAGTVAAAGAPTLGIGSIVVGAIWIVADILVQEIFEWLENKNVCTLLPLWWNGYPFVSGVYQGKNILLMRDIPTNDVQDALEESEDFNGE